MSRKPSGKSSSLSALMVNGIGGNEKWQNLFAR